MAQSEQGLRQPEHTRGGSVYGERGMKRTTGLVIGDTSIMVKKDGNMARIAIVSKKKLQVLNCTNSEMLRFLIDSIDMMMDPNA